MEPGDEFDRAARALLDASRVGDREAIAQAIALLQPRIARLVRAKVRELGGIPPREAMDPDDVVQEVLLRMADAPPDGRDRNPPAAAVVIAWTEKVAANYLCTLGRKKDANAIRTSVEEGLPPDSVGTPAELPVAAPAWLEPLRRNYPRGFELASLQLAEPGLTTPELAERLGLSRDNVYQIRSRTLRLLERLQSESAGKERLS
jgi:DNA-directed RNA polymerase specialized sigma24 family protein